MQTQTINCLRCRQCRLEPDTDFSKPTTNIFCAKSNQRQAVVIAFDCAKAKPQLKFVDRVETDGDLTRSASEVEKLFIRQRAQLPAKVLAKCVKRSVATIQNLRGDLGCRPGHSREIVAQMTSWDRRKRGGDNPAFNAAQHDFIMACYNAGRWPFRAYHLNHGREAYEALVAEIVEGVAQRGREWSWHSIVKHVQYTSPHYKRVQAAKRVRNRERKRAALSVKREFVCDSIADCATA